MSTVADLIANCRNDYLLVGSREERNLLAADLTADATSVAMTYEIPPLGRGAKLSIDLEDFYVWDVNQTAKTATVQRGQFGSTAAAHTTGATVRINARVTDAQILRAVNDELKALSANDLFQIKTVDLSYKAAVDGYDLAGVTDVLSVWMVRYKSPTADTEWPVISPSLWEYQRSLPTTSFASGHAIFIRGEAWPGQTIRVWYRAPFSATLAANTDNVTTVSGLHAEAVDLLALGAAVRLTAGRETHRNFEETQGDTRRATEVPPGANIGGWRQLMAYRTQRLREEQQRLARLYPVRVR